MELARISIHLLYARYKGDMYEVLNIDVMREKLTLADKSKGDVFEIDYDSNIELLAIVDREE